VHRRKERELKLPAPAYRQADGRPRKGNFILIVHLDPAYPAKAGRGTCRSKKKCSFYLLEEDLIQKILCPWAFGIFEKTDIGPPFNNRSFIHEDDLVSHFSRESHLMGDYDHGHPTL
jgi:hypothetical protein